MSWYVVTAWYGSSEGPRSAEWTVTDMGFTDLWCDPVPFATSYRFYRRYSGSPSPPGSYDEYYDSSTPYINDIFPLFEGNPGPGAPVTVQPPAESFELTVDYLSVVLDADFTNYNFLRGPLVLDYSYSKLAFGTETGTEYATIYANGTTNSIYIASSYIYLNGSSRVQTSGKLAVGTSQIHSSNMMSVGGAVSIGSGYDDDDAPTNGLLVEGNVCIGTTTLQTEKFYVTGTGKFTGILTTNSDFICASESIFGDTTIITGAAVAADNSVAIGNNRFGTAGQPAVKAGLCLYNDAFNPAYGSAIISNITLVSPQRYCLRQVVRAGTTSGEPYFYWRTDRTSDSSNELTVARLRSPADDDAYFITISPNGQCYRWGTNSTDDIPPGSTETFLSLPFGGYSDFPGSGGAKYAQVSDGAVMLRTSAGSGAVYWYWPLHLPCGGTITGVRVRLEVENVGFSSPWGTGYLVKKSNTDASWGTTVTSLNVTTSGSYVWSISPSETVEAGHAYFLVFYAGASAGGGVDIKMHHAEIDMTLDRHYPRWMV